MPTTTLDATTPDQLPPLVLPDSPHYDAARQAWNLHTDQRPAAVCVATTTEHVQAAMAYARAHGLRVAAQTTGHLSATLPSLECTLLLRTALHDGVVEVDPAERVARIKAGARWGDVVEAVAPHGLAVMHGSSPSVGVDRLPPRRRPLLLRAHARPRGQPRPRVRGRHPRRRPAARRRRATAPSSSGPCAAGAAPTRSSPRSSSACCPTPRSPAARCSSPPSRRGACCARGTSGRRRRRTRSRPRSACCACRRIPEVPEPLRGVPTVCVDGVALDAAGGGAPGAAPALASPSRSWAASARCRAPPSRACTATPRSPSRRSATAILLEKLDDVGHRGVPAGRRRRARRCWRPSCATSAARWPRRPPAPAPAGTSRASSSCSASASRTRRRRRPSSARSSTATSARWRPGRPGRASRASPSAGARWRPACPDAALARLARVRAAVDPDGLLVPAHTPGP